MLYKKKSWPQSVWQLTLTPAPHYGDYMEIKHSEETVIEKIKSLSLKKTLTLQKKYESIEYDCKCMLKNSASIPSSYFLWLCRQVQCFHFQLWLNVLISMSASCCLIPFYFQWQIYVSVHDFIYFILTIVLDVKWSNVDAILSFFPQWTPLHLCVDTSYDAELQWSELQLHNYCM